MGAHVVHEDDVAFFQGPHEDLLDIGQEGRAIHRAVDHVRCCDAIDAQGGHEGERLPVAVGHLGNQPLAPRSAAVEPGHLGRHRSLVNEHETRGLQSTLLGLQLPTCGGDIGSILLGRVEDFFLSVILWRS